MSPSEKRSEQDGIEGRECTNCGKSVDELPYELWVFHTCRSCVLDATPKRWDGAGTARKWRYFPRWHMTRHPQLPQQKRERFA